MTVPQMNKRIEQSEAESPFAKLASINVNEHVEKKNGLSYLTWAWALDQLFRADPAANWTFNEPTMFGETMMVSCTVTAFNKSITMHLPVMDHRNQAIKNPDAFQVNKNMMRCLVKAIACHGLGLYIYAGEDLPEHEAEAFAKQANKVTPTAGALESFKPDEQKFIRELAEGIQVHFDQNSATITEIVAMLEERHLDSEEKVAVWSLLDSKCRSAIKKAKATPTAAEITAQA